MKLRRVSLLATHVFIFTSLLFGYSNCSPNKGSEEEQVASGAGPNSSFIADSSCEGQLKYTFSSGYHSFLTQNCASCHSNGPGKGQFANPDVNIAYSNFMQVGYSKVSNNAISDGHNPPYSGTQHTQVVNDLKVTWVQALSEFDSCNGGSGTVISNLSLSDRSKFGTVAKTIPSMNINEERRLEFDLSNDVSALAEKNLSSLPGAKLSVMIKKYEVGTMKYYTVHTPRIYGSTQDIQITGIFTKINGRFVQFSNNFRYVNKMIPKNLLESSPESLVSTGALIIPGAMSADDQVSFNFETLEPTIIPPPPPPVLVGFSSAVVQKANSSGVITLQVTLDKPSSEVISLTLSEDPSNICGVNAATVSVNATTCLPNVYSVICPGGTCAANAPVMSRARSVVGASFNRFDWDYKFISTSLLFAPGETSKTIQIQTSKDIRHETNRLLTLKLEKGIGNANLGVAETHVVFDKRVNPVPGATEVTFSKLMNSLNGKLALNCLNCHNSNPTKQQGGFDIADYEMLVAKQILKPGQDLMSTNPVTGIVTKTYASKLFKRMNPQDPEAGSYITPMPRDKYLDYDTDISYVEKWILNGAKNN